MDIRRVIASAALALAATTALGGEGPPAKPSLTTVNIKSSKDGEAQPVKLYVPPGAEVAGQGEPVPLLVHLHTWSNHGGCGGDALAEVARRGWALVAPEYRGPNKRPEACASDLAVQDVLDAVAAARERARIDPRRIYLYGLSGGGHMAMVMAARAPELWAGVSAWCGISDLAVWRGQRGDYGKDIEVCCGGAPGASPQVDEEYRKRSPIFHLGAAKGLPLDLNAGIGDGSVPFSHSLRAFNVLAEANGPKDKMLTEEQLTSVTRTRKVPAELAAGADERAGKFQVLLRRQAGAARVTVFQGGHEADFSAAIEWLSAQKGSGGAQKQEAAP